MEHGESALGVAPAMDQHPLTLRKNIPFKLRKPY